MKGSCADCRFRSPRHNLLGDECAEEIMTGKEPSKHPVRGERGRWFCVERRFSERDACGPDGNLFQPRTDR